MKCYICWLIVDLEADLATQNIVKCICQSSICYNIWLSKFFELNYYHLPGQQNKDKLESIIPCELITR